MLSVSVELQLQGASCQAIDTVSVFVSRSCTDNPSQSLWEVTQVTIRDIKLSEYMRCTQCSAFKYTFKQKKKFLEGRAVLARKADNITAICEPIV
jgi:hypothetical protein